MPKIVTFEQAAELMKQLAESKVAEELQHANEAETRLCIIDEVLTILGWDKREYNPERPTSNNAYTDYLLTISGERKLVVEAKKSGVIKPFDRAITQHEYKNSFLYNYCGDQMQSLLEQCRRYCSDCGVHFAVATTGEIWIVLVFFKSGVDWGNVNAVVFHSLHDIVTRFSEFYSLLSREAVKNNSLQDKFNRMLIVRPSVAIRPREQYEQVVDLGRDIETHVIRAFFTHYMSDITDKAKQEMLEQCYVMNRELTDFSQEIQQLLRFDAVIAEQEEQLDEEISEIDEQRLVSEIEMQSDFSQPKTILLVGNIGAGKTTFIHRFIKYYIKHEVNERQDKRKRKHICVVLDLINRGDSDIEYNQSGEQRISKLLLDELAQEFEDKIDPYEYAVLLKCFEPEIARFRKRKTYLFESDPIAYRIEEEHYVSTLVANRYDHLVGYLRHAKRRFNTWLVFDNVDRGSASYQKFVYNFAHQLARDTGCVTIITLREDTFLEAQSAGFLDVRNSDTIFRIAAPEFKQIVASRRRYVDRLLDQQRLPHSLKPYELLVQCLNTHIKALILADNPSIRLTIATLSLNNLRSSFAMLRDYYLSIHSSFHDFYAQQNSSSAALATDDQLRTIQLDYKQEDIRFLQALMLGNAWSYQEGKSKVVNLFAVSHQEKGSHFLLLRILAYLHVERNNPASRFLIKCSKLINAFVSLSYQRHHVNNAIQKLLYDQLVVSPDVPDSANMDLDSEQPNLVFEDIKVALSAKGHYYLHKIASHHYYQTRVGEDTVWYNEELADAYISCLRDQFSAQAAQRGDDLLQATNAREIFVQYLKRSLLEETQDVNSQQAATPWLQVINALVERTVFAEQITPSSSVVDEQEPVQDHLSPHFGHKPTQSPLRVVKPQGTNMAPQQLKLFSQTNPDYDGALRTAIEDVGRLPKNRKHQDSWYIIRVLWALEIASRTGLEALRASDIARIISEYGDDPVAAPNVAKFFRNQKLSHQFVHLWTEEPEGHYVINSVGRNLLNSIMGTGDRTTATHTQFPAHP